MYLHWRARSSTRSACLWISRSRQTVVHWTCIDFQNLDLGTVSLTFHQLLQRPLSFELMQNTQHWNHSGAQIISKITNLRTVLRKQQEVAHRIWRSCSYLRRLINLQIAWRPLGLDESEDSEASTKMNPGSTAATEISVSPDHQDWWLTNGSSTCVLR